MHGDLGWHFSIWVSEKDWYSGGWPHFGPAKEPALGRSQGAPPPGPSPTQPFLCLRPSCYGCPSAACLTSPACVGPVLVAVRFSVLHRVCSQPARFREQASTRNVWGNVSWAAVQRSLQPAWDFAWIGIKAVRCWELGVAEAVVSGIGVIVIFGWVGMGQRRGEEQKRSFLSLLWNRLFSVQWMDIFCFTNMPSSK